VNELFNREFIVADLYRNNCIIFAVNKILFSYTLNLTSRSLLFMKLVKIRYGVYGRHLSHKHRRSQKFIWGVQSTSPPVPTPPLSLPSLPFLPLPSSPLHGER